MLILFKYKNNKPRLFGDFCAETSVYMFILQTQTFMTKNLTKNNISQVLMLAT